MRCVGEQPGRIVVSGLLRMLKMRLRLSAVEACGLLIAVFSSVAGENSLKKAELGKPASLYCDVEGGSHGDMEITWKTPDQLVANFSKGVFSCGTGFENRVRFENVHSKGGFSLHINPVVFSDTDTYSCFNTTHLIKTWNLVVTGEFTLLCWPSRMEKVKIRGEGEPLHCFTLCLCCFPMKVSPPKEVHVIERGTATLPCYGAISRRLVNEQLNVHWKKDGYAVLNLTKGATHHYPGFGYRANMLLHDIRQGDFSMVIKNVEMTDDGNYECFTENNEGKILNSVKLRVLKGIHHGYRQLVSDFTGNYFTFYVSSADVEVYLLREKIAEKKKMFAESGILLQRVMRIYLNVLS